jgi:hypothetical protein
LLAVVSHDAGGAEILSSWLRRIEEPYCLSIDGPAKEIFRRKLGVCDSLPLSKAIEQSDWVICGTSWQSNLEKIAILEAKAAGKKVVAVLDHWVNYRERFQLEEVAVFPDEVWVVDSDAERLAKLTFPQLSVAIQPNPYFEDLLKELGHMPGHWKMRGHSECSVLYVCEPIREHALLQYGSERYLGYTEEDALRFFLENTDALGCPINKITIRPHPSENRDKYAWASQNSAMIFSEEFGKTLLEQVAAADIVVGCESMAMVVGLLAQRRVISAIPTGGRKCQLPQTGIEHMQSLVKSYRKF